MSETRKLTERIKNGTATFGEVGVSPLAVLVTELVSNALIHDAQHGIDGTENYVQTLRDVQHAIDADRLENRKAAALCLGEDTLDKISKAIEHGTSGLKKQLAFVNEIIDQCAHCDAAREEERMKGPAFAAREVSDE